MSLNSEEAGGLALIAVPTIGLLAVGLAQGAGGPLAITATVAAGIAAGIAVAYRRRRYGRRQGFSALERGLRRQADQARGLLPAPGAVIRRRSRLRRRAHLQLVHGGRP